MKEIIGLKKAIGDYNKANKDGYASPRYGYLMYDKGSGEIWTDEFYNLGHSDWKKYYDANIVNLGKLMRISGIRNITMQTVRDFVESL